MFRKINLTLLFLALACWLAGAAGPALAIQTSDFLLLYSNNVHGEMEPCG